MKILIISHTIPENASKLEGRWSIIPENLKKKGFILDHVLRNEWSSFYLRYKSFKPDYVIAVGPIGAMIAFYKKIGLLKCPLIHDWNDNYSEIFGGPVERFLAGLMEKYAIKNSDFVITPSMYRYEKGKIWQKRQDRIYFLPHGVKDHFFKKPKKITLPGTNKKKIIYVGELSKTKSVDKLILSLNDQPADLILIGTEKQEMVSIARKNVYFLGKKRSIEVPNYLAAADYLVLTENNDSALKLMEYLAMGKTILAPTGRLDKFASFEKNIILYGDFEDISKIIGSKRKLKNKHSSYPKTWRKITEMYKNLLRSRT